MAPEKDYTHRSWIAVTLLIAVLIGLSLIPPQTLGGVSLRRANILSDLISFEEDLEKAEKAIDLDDADFHIDLTQVARQIADTVSVLRAGKVVDAGSVEDVFLRPTSDYTRELMDAIPGKRSIDFVTHPA